MAKAKESLSRFDSQWEELKRAIAKPSIETSPADFERVLFLGSAVKSAFTLMPEGPLGREYHALISHLEKTVDDYIIDQWARKEPNREKIEDALKEVERLFEKQTLSVIRKACYDCEICLGGD